MGKETEYVEIEAVLKVMDAVAERVADYVKLCESHKKPVETKDLHDFARACLLDALKNLKVEFPDTEPCGFVKPHEIDRRANPPTPKNDKNKSTK